MTSWIKANAVKITGWMMVPVTLWVVIVLATSKEVVNKVGSQAASVEPRLQQIETDQKQLSIIVEGIIELIESVDKIHSQVLDVIDEKEIAQLKNKIEETKIKLRAMTKEAADRAGDS